ncbi:hypothetical protein E3J62_03460 [candidate division TA06 bacterium]|uniref:Uncharacterized protein n=1 Tax=candidate division TA06 bacterium TaxID=2250710 RepID=A0A523UWI9_UNCT6|nr:MAG: hypothetical protein E3J62_03460 [candidate division TA06 bacterium]
MNLIWGMILLVLSLIGWIGQVITVFRPVTAAKMGLTEPEANVDPTFFADARGEAIWDAVSLWTLTVAAILLILDNPSWAYFGLVGSGSYLYFAGRGTVVRLVMQRRGIRIGLPQNLKVIRVFLTLWGLMAIGTIVLAVNTIM